MHHYVPRSLRVTKNRKKVVFFRTSRPVPVFSVSHFLAAAGAAAKNALNKWVITLDETKHFSAAKKCTKQLLPYAENDKLLKSFPPMLVVTFDKGFSIELISHSQVHVSSQTAGRADCS